MQLGLTKRALAALAAATLLGGCVTTEREQTRLNRKMDGAAMEIMLGAPGLHSEAAGAAGYLIVMSEASKLPGLPPATRAMLVDQRDDSRIPVRVSNLDTIGGDGVETFNLLMLFEDGEDLDRARAGTWRHNRATSRELWYVYFKPDFGAPVIYDLNTLEINP